MVIRNYATFSEFHARALIKRDPCEDFFGIQLAGSHIDSLTRCAELLNENVGLVISLLSIILSYTGII